MQSVVDRNVVILHMTVFPCYIEHHMVDMYSGVKVQLHVLITSTVDGD